MQPAPGYDSDVVVTCTSAALSGVFNGVESWGHAIATESIRVDGPPRLAKALPRWFLGSPFTPLVAARRPRWPHGGVVDVGWPQSKTIVRRP